MGDRKELNKYIPPDFDPKHLSKVRIKKKSKEDIRFMLPCGIQCSTCGEFMGAGKKFNAKKENAGEYLKIKRFRFYWKCNVCSTGLVMITDPQNSDYKIERGGTRIFDIYRTKTQEKDAQAAADKEIEEGNDAMSAMEAKAEASRREMDSIAALETLQEQGERNRNVGPDQIMQALRNQDAQVENDVSKTMQDQDEADAAAAQLAFAAQKVRRIPDVSFSSSSSSSSTNSTKSISTFSTSSISSKRRRDAEKTTTTSSSIPVILKRRKKIDSNPPAAAFSMIANYKSSSDEE